MINFSPNVNQSIVVAFMCLFHCIIEASRGAGAQSVTVKTGGGFNPHSRKLNIYLHLYFNFFTQRLQNLSESGQRSVLTLGSLCLHCCVRDTA